MTSVTSMELLEKRNLELEAKCNRYSDEIHTLESIKIDLSEKLQESDLNLHNALKDLQDLRIELSSNSEKSNNLEKELSETKEKFTTCEAENQKLKSEVQSVSEENDQLKAVNEGLSQLDEKNSEKILNLDEEISELKSKIEQESDKKAEIEKLLEEVEFKKISLESKITDLETSLIEASLKENSLTSDLMDKKTEIETLKIEQDKVTEDLNKKIRNLEKTLENTETRNHDLTNENKKFKDEIEKISLELSETKSQSASQIESLELKTRLLKDEIWLMKEATVNYEKHIEFLKTELTEKTNMTDSLQEQLQDMSSKATALESQLKGIEVQEKVGASLTKTLKKISLVINPTSLRRKKGSFVKFDANPGMTSNELYVKFVNAFDAYKAELAQRLALEEGLKQFTKEIKLTSPRTVEKNAKLQLLKRSFMNLSRRFNEASRHNMRLEVELKNMATKNNLLMSKKVAYKKSTKVLKDQVQNLLFEKNKGVQSEFVFDDMKGLHEKYVKALKKLNENESVNKLKQSELKAESETLMKELSNVRAERKRINEEHEKDTRIMADKIRSLSVIAHAVKENSLTDLKGNKLINGDEEKYKKIIQELNENFRLFQQDKLKSISNAEKRMREMDKELSFSKTKTVQAETALEHTQKMKSFVESENKKLEEDMRALQQKNLKLEETLSAVEEEGRSLRVKLAEGKEKFEKVSSESEYAKGALSAIEKAEKRAVQKVSELNDLIAIQKTKIERLETTNKLMSHVEKEKIEKLLTQKESLESDWLDLRRSHDLDLKTGRVALETTNSLFTQALDDLRREREAVDESRKENEGLQSRLQSIASELEKTKTELEKLRSWKERAENAKMTVLKKTQNQVDTQYECKASTLLSLENEVAELKARAEHFKQMYNTANLMLQKTEQKLETQYAENEKAKKSILSESKEINDRFFKVSRAFQITLVENGKVNGENKELQKTIAAVRQELAREREEAAAKVLAVEESLCKSRKAVEAERLLVLDQRKNFEDEVERHGKTVEKIKSLSQALNKAEEESKLLRIKNADSDSKIDALKKKISENELRSAQREQELNTLLEDAKKNIELISDELDKTNSLNTYFLRRYQLESKAQEKDERFRKPQKDETGKTETMSEIGIDVESAKDDKKTDKDLTSSDQVEFDRARAAISERAELNKMTKQIAKNMGDLQSYKELLERARREKADFESKAEKFKRLLDAEKVERELKENLIKDLKQELSKAFEQLEKNSEKTKDAEEYENALHTIQVLTENNKQLRSEMSTFKTKIEELKKKVISHKESLAPLTSEIQALKAKTSDLEIEVEIKDGLAKDWEERCLRILDKNNLLDPIEHEKLKKSLESTKKELEEAKAQSEQAQQKLSREIDTLKEQKTEEGKRSQALEARLEEQRRLESQNIARLVRDKVSLEAKIRELSAMQFDSSKHLDARKQKSLIDMKNTIDKMIFEIEKYKLLVKKMDQIIKEERETSQIFKRNAQNANARFSEKQKEFDALLSSFNSHSSKPVQTHESTTLHPQSEEASPLRTTTAISLKESNPMKGARNDTDRESRIEREIIRVLEKEMKGTKKTSPEYKGDSITPKEGRESKIVRTALGENLSAKKTLTRKERPTHDQGNEKRSLESTPFFYFSKQIGSNPFFASSVSTEAAKSENPKPQPETESREEKRKLESENEPAAEKTKIPKDTVSSGSFHSSTEKTSEAKSLYPNLDFKGEFVFNKPSPFDDSVSSSSTKANFDNTSLSDYLNQKRGKKQEPSKVANKHSDIGKTLFNDSPSKKPRISFLNFVEFNKDQATPNIDQGGSEANTDSNAESNAEMSTKAKNSNFSVLPKPFEETSEPTEKTSFEPKTEKKNLFDFEFLKNSSSLGKSSLLFRDEIGNENSFETAFNAIAKNRQEWEETKRKEKHTDESARGLKKEDEFVVGDFRDNQTQEERDAEELALDDYNEEESETSMSDIEDEDNFDDDKSNQDKDEDNNDDDNNADDNNDDDKSNQEQSMKTIIGDKTDEEDEKEIYVDDDVIEIDDSDDYDDTESDENVEKDDFDEKEEDKDDFEEKSDK